MKRSGKKRGKTMKHKQLLIAFLLCGILYLFFNELILLPYSVYTPGSFTLIEDMVQRSPWVYFGLVFMDFTLIFLGSQFFLMVLDSSEIEESLTDCSNMRESTNKGEVVKETLMMYGNFKGRVL